MQKAIFQKSNALIAPYVEPWRGGADLSGLPAEVRLNYRGRAVDEWLEPNLSSKVVQQGSYLWGGPFKNHFGHLMTDTLPRLWAWNPDKYDAVIFSPLITEKQPKAWAVELLNRMGIPESQMIFAHEPSLFESVDFPVAGSSLGDGPSDWYLGKI